MNSALSVYRGEIQCRLLGMAVETFTPDGRKCPPGVPGELVCLKPFPCQPVGFWPLPGYGSEADVQAAQERYKQAYFSEFEGVWCECRDIRDVCVALKTILVSLTVHGDHVLLTPSRAGNGGGLVMLGRSDGVL